ncbi:DUF6538 domain-containing protein [Methylobacillus glycogenes]|uniref:DUF6538 domain-containing protein n=1 Tax=Methylobacillus glycogenes TaxID=406 RepID=UPI0034E2AE07
MRESVSRVRIPPSPPIRHPSLRGKTYYFHGRIPDDVVAHYGNGTSTLKTFSLNTSIRRLAIRLAREHAAHVDIFMPVLIKTLRHFFRKECIKDVRLIRRGMMMELCDHLLA